MSNARQQLTEQSERLRADVTHRVQLTTINTKLAICVIICLKIYKKKNKTRALQNARIKTRVDNKKSHIDKLSNFFEITR